MLSVQALLPAALWETNLGVTHCVNIGIHLQCTVYSWITKAVL
jgi:hypothetical protein